MKKLNKYLFIFCLISIVLSGCEDFLDENPSKTSSLVPETVDHLESLLNNYTTFNEENNPTFLFSSDDFGLLIDLYDAYPSAYGPSETQFALWDKDYIPSTGTINNFDEEWKKIFTANLVLFYLDEVSGDETTKSNLKAEAHFIRAYSYFILANTFCLPYTEENKNEMGLPIKNSTNFESSIERVSIEDTWNFIKADLEEALKISVEFKMVNDKFKSWRASTVAVKSFAARYYLYLNDYANAQKYAEEALALHSKLMDYNVDMRYSDLNTFVEIDGVQVKIKLPYTAEKQDDLTDRMEWKELYYYRFLSNGRWWNIPSQDLLSLYDQDYDLRYRYHIVEDYSYYKGAISPAYSYPGYLFFHFGEIPSGPTVAEMLLIKAECEVRTGNWTQGLTTVNQLRAVRMDNTAPTEAINLSAVSQEVALTKILEERRREMPFTQRWYDLRRFNNNEDPSDDVTITRTFYPYSSSAVLSNSPTISYTLEKKSRRYAAPIPQDNITNSNGELKQNLY